MDSYEQISENQFLGVMQQYLAYEGWDDDIAIAEDGDASIKTTMCFDGQTHLLRPLRSTSTAPLAYLPIAMMRLRSS
jgi:hypothetical protein